MKTKTHKPGRSSAKALVPLLVSCGVAALACGSESPGGTIGPISGAVAIVNYSATSTGDATFTSVTYRNEAGDDVTETNVGPQWSKTLSVTSGRQIAMAAAVTVATSGSAEIRMTASGNGASVNENSSRSASKGVSFAVNLPAVTLP